MHGNQCLGGYCGNKRKPTCLCQNKWRLKRKRKKLEKMMCTKFQGWMTKRLLIPWQKKKIQRNQKVLRGNIILGLKNTEFERMVWYLGAWYLVTEIGFACSAEGMNRYISLRSTLNDIQYRKEEKGQPLYFGREHWTVLMTEAVWLA